VTHSPEPTTPRSFAALVVVAVVAGILIALWLYSLVSTPPPLG
jgi:hypothetical protein